MGMRRTTSNKETGHSCHVNATAQEYAVTLDYKSVMLDQKLKS